MTDQSKDLQGNSAWKANFVGAVQCPWTSNAPISASTNCKVGGKCSDTCHAPPKSQQHYGINPNSGRITPWTTRNKPTITYFNNFVRLMQLFPEMHPASLHTAMALCKNDFISTVDRLLYVRRYKNGTFFRKDAPVATITRRVQRKVPAASSTVQRSPIPAGHEEGKSATTSGAVPQPMETAACQSNGDFDAALPTRSFDAKRLVYNNKAKLKNTKAETSELSAAVTSNAETPQRNFVVPQEINNPLIPEDLSRNKIATST